MLKPDFIGELVVNLGVFIVFLPILCISAIISDYVLPHIPFVRKWLNSLPDYEDDIESFETAQSSPPRTKPSQGQKPL